MKATDKEKSQVEKFRDAARELETDQPEEAFDRVLKKVIKDAHPTDHAPHRLKRTPSRQIIERNGDETNCNERRIQPRFAC
ncbi:hypothetical protein NKI38_18240 [Mesorhizobium sp. M0621]|uniref:hypothetical protein n=1 Tax=Mesorhizobium sp. M0621 TaxID=2956974 RepID=UPI003334C81F